MDWDYAELYELKNKVFDSVQVFKNGKYDNDAIVFKNNNGEEYHMTHRQDCCEDVYIEDINGKLDNLVGVPILQVEESTNNEETDYSSKTWTFYKFATSKGYVTIRWCGESNGYYSERVDLLKIENDDL